jgi:hypothetical protein
MATQSKVIVPEVVLGLLFASCGVKPVVVIEVALAWT